MHGPAIDEASRVRLKTLEEELQTTRENLQATVEELEQATKSCGLNERAGRGKRRAAEHE
jgi:hypothetical protein